MRSIVTLAALVLVTAGTMPGQTVTMQGTLIGESGAPVRGAYVLVHEYYPSNSQNVAQNWEMRADAEGRFSFNVQVGCYDVFVSEVRFLPQSQRVCVNDAHNVALKVRMKADPHPRLTLQE